MDMCEIYNMLKKCSVCDIGASADMLWVNVDNKYAIDIQSPFRIIINKDIVLSNTELCCDQDTVREILSKCKSLLDLPCSIDNICSTRCNDLHIFLSNGIIIETFTNTTEEDDEQWRIFERHNKDKKHYVAYLHEICEE